LGSLFAQADTQQSSGITVNGAAISTALLEQIITTNVAQGAKDTPEMRQAIKDELIAREVLAQESVRLGLDKTPQGLEQMALLRQNLLVELLLKDYAEKNPVSDEAIRTEYDRQVNVLSKMKDLQQYKVGLIVLNSETEAHAVLASLHKGASFEKLAREKSIDPSKTAGGSLGWLLPNQIVPVISTVMVKLAKGAVVTVPIQTPAGWHVIKLEDKRAYKIPTLEERKILVRQGLERQQRAEYIRKLSGDAKVTQ
jgi:peptidyl-prolyl cis-trans isomerase C